MIRETVYKSQERQRGLRRIKRACFRAGIAYQKAGFLLRVRKRLNLLLICGCVLTGGFSGSGQGVHPLLFLNDELTGFPGIEIFNVSSMALGGNGDLLAEVRFSGDGIDLSNDDALVVVNPTGSLSLLFREGDPVSGNVPPGSTYRSANSLFVDQSGQAAFFAGLEIPDNFGGSAIIKGNPTAIRAIAWNGQPFAQDEEKTLRVSNHRLADNGRYALSGNLNNTRDSIWQDEPDDTRLIVVEVQYYPGLRLEGTFASVGSKFEINQNGEVVFTASERWRPKPESNSTTVDRGLWVKQGDQVIPIAYEDDPVPWKCRSGHRPRLE